LQIVQSIINFWIVFQTIIGFWIIEYKSLFSNYTIQNINNYKFRKAFSKVWMFKRKFYGGEVKKKPTTHSHDIDTTL